MEDDQSLWTYLNKISFSVISAGIGPWGHPNTDVIPVSIKKEAKIGVVAVLTVIVRQHRSTTVEF